MSASRPNILFYFSDQQRADTCGCYGQPLALTPQLDKMAAEGVLFENAFSPQPVCGPCRAIFQTGRYATDIGCFRNNLMLPHDVKTLADYLEEAGYETAYVGKWHLASQGGLPGQPEINHRTTPIPLAYRGGYSGYWRAADALEYTSHGYNGYVFDEENKKRPFQGYRADAITDFALDFFSQRDKDKPFFMTVSQLEPHHQNDRGHYEGPEGSKERFRDCVLPKDLELLGGNAAEEYPDYLGACERLDYNLGRLIERLKAEGLYEKTIIICSSDHGSHFSTRNHDAHLCGSDDYKRSCHDASLHVPLVIRGPGYRGGKRVKDLVSTGSLAKSILAMAGIEAGDKMIGEDLKDVADGRTEGRENVVFAQISESRCGRCIRTEDFTYSVTAPGVDGTKVPSAKAYADDFLYDLRKDPYQLENLIDDPRYREIKEKLRRRLFTWIEESEGYRPAYIESCEK